jgi:hypothetical protein
MRAIICDRCGETETYLQIDELNKPWDLKKISKELLIFYESDQVHKGDLCSKCYKQLINFLHPEKDDKTVNSPEVHHESPNLEGGISKQVKNDKKHRQMVTVAEKICRTCGKTYKPSSNVQKDCPDCSKKVKKPQPVPS